MKSKPRRILALVALTAAFTLGSAGQQAAREGGSKRRMSIDDLRKTIAAAASARHPERDLVRRLAAVELTERLSPSTLRQLAALSPANEQALQYLADVSAFLDLPVEELPSKTRPDPATQKAIVERAIHYVARTLPHLPNFLATRVTQQLVSADPGRPLDQRELVGGFYFRNVFRTSVTYRNGKETENLLPQNAEWLATKKGARKKTVKRDFVPAHPDGLVSNGEFGPMLAVILVDAAKGKLHWGHWETIEGKPAAAFQFAVDRGSSHFSVSPWQVPIMEFAASHSAAAAVPGATSGSNDVLDGVSDLLQGEVLTPEEEVVAYHGQVAVDPESGAILRIAVEAEPRPEDTIQLANILVEYGHVRLGGSEYICPIHSAAISRSRGQNESTVGIPFLGPSSLQLNDVRFTDYRRFGSESTLLPVDSK